MNNTPIVSLCLLLAPVVHASSLDSAFTAASVAARLAGQSRVSAASDRDTQEALLALLDDQDPAVRAQAARALKNSVLENRRIEDRLTVIAASATEVDSVRVEAIKSLALAAAQSNAPRRTLIAEARNPRNSDRIRAISCKALWASTSANDARSALTALLQDPSAPAAVRAGAAWGLWRDAAATGATQRVLVESVNDGALEASVRLEAVKSLYESMEGQRSIRDAVRAVAESIAAPVSLRAAAILAHHRISTEYPVRRWLQDLASSSAPSELRVAATQAQTAGVTPELARYFHLSNWGRSTLDPLDAQ